MREHFDRINVTLEKTDAGDYRAEARTMDTYGLNFTNYNFYSSEAVKWLRESMAALGITADEFIVENLHDHDRRQAANAKAGEE